MTVEISISIDSLWTPPEGMDARVAADWRGFYRRAHSGKAGYSITPREYRLLYLAQKGRCWVCREARGIHPDDPQGRGSRRLAVDHNHTTGAVRGLLCSGSLEPRTCNRLIEWFTPEALARAADYKRNPPARVLRAINQAINEMTEATGAGLNDAQQDLMASGFLWTEAAE